MKFKPVLLCSALALLVSAPVWADRVDPGFIRLTDNRKFSVVADGHSDPSDLTFPGTLSLQSVPRPDATITLVKFADSDFRDYDPRSSRADTRWKGSEKAGDDPGNPDPVAAPEPGSLLLSLFGLCGLGFVAYRHKAVAKVV